MYNAVPLKSALKKPKGSGGHSAHNGQAVQLPSSSKSNSDPPTTSRYVYEKKSFYQIRVRSCNLSKPVDILFLCQIEQVDVSNAKIKSNANT